MRAAVNDDWGLRTHFLFSLFLLFWGIMGI
jgi:hypothetical protein